MSKNSHHNKLIEALKLFQQSRFSEAEPILESIIKRDRRNFDAAHYLGIIKVSKGDLDRGFRLLRASLQQSQTFTAYTENYANVLLQAAHYDSAIEVCNEAIKKIGYTEKLYVILISSLFQLEKYQDVITTCKFLIDKNPNNAFVYSIKSAALSELGRDAEALDCVEKATSLAPRFSDAIMNKGNILAKLKRLDEATKSYEEAIRLNPKLFFSHSGLGNVFRELKRYDEAFAAYDKALSIKPDLEGAWLGRGNAFYDLKRYDEASAAYDKALSIKPDLEGAWVGRGNVFRDLNRYDEAFAAYDKALSIKPDLEHAWLGRGNVFIDLNRYDEAFAAYDKALSIKPDLEGAWLGRGNVFRALKRYDEAFAAYDKALSIKPDLEGAWLGRGNVFRDLKRYDDAFAAYDKALSIKPDLEGAWIGRGNVFRELKRYDDAFAAYDKALSIKPDLEGAWLGRGNVFTDLKRYDEAFAAFDKAIAAASDPANAYWNKSLVLLTVGDFINGWDLYEWRFRNDENRLEYFRNGALYKLRQSKDNFKSKDVTVLAEQGIGDEIMFASTLPDLITDAERVSFECDTRIKQLFQRSFPSVAFFERDNKRSAVSNISDLVVKAGSLCYAYRRSAASFFQKSYLKVDHQKELSWKEALINQAKLKLKVGISWRGGTQKTGIADRSFPLSAFKDIISIDETYFVNLQYGDVQAEIAHFNDDSSGKLLNCPYEDFNNFDDLAAFISALDLVISVQNTTVHLCGAVGKPCWGLIPFRPEWRYGSEGESMAWYSSVKLYRQPAAGDWHAVLNRVQSDLQKLVHVPAI